MLVLQSLSVATRSRASSSFPRWRKFAHGKDFFSKSESYVYLEPCYSANTKSGRVINAPVGSFRVCVEVYVSFEPSCLLLLARPQMNKKSKSRALQREEAEIEADLAEISRSIEKSRKRNLEVGLLRGDLVQDRLRVQENSASPVLKRPRSEEAVSLSSPNNMAMSKAGFCASMDEKINPKLAGLDDLKQKIDRMDETIKGNTVRLNRQEATAKITQVHIAEIRAELVQRGTPHRAWRFLCPRQCPLFRSRPLTGVRRTFPGLGAP